MLADKVPVEPPVIPPDTLGNAQLYVVPAGTIPFVILTGFVLKFPPLHIFSVIGFIAGFGFTVMITVNVAPTHGFAVGVTV